MVFLRLSLFSGIITRLRMLRSIIIVFTSELSLCSNKMVLDFCWFRRVSEHMSCPFQPFASLFAIFSMTFLRSWLLVQVLGPGSLTALVKGLLAVPCRVLRLALLADTPGGSHFFGKLRCGKPMVPTGKSSKKHDSHDTWLIFIGFPHLC